MKNRKNTPIIPTGILKFQFGVHWRTKEIIDGKVKLEDQLSKIIASLEIYALNEIEEQKRLEEIWKINREKEERRLERETKINNEFQEVLDLINKVKRHHCSMVIRDFVKNCNEDDTYKKWALKKADWYDPFIKYDDSLLTEVHKKALDDCFKV